MSDHYDTIESMRNSNIDLLALPERHLGQVLAVSEGIRTMPLPVPLDSPGTICPIALMEVRTPPTQGASGWTPWTRASFKATTTNSRVLCDGSLRQSS